MEKVKVEQLLFGYENGHRLIESSLKKSLIQQKDVEILSDASGSGKFKEYISCFPLVDDGYYVFSKTWYADEMERPGCVWTHMLLIRFEDLECLSGRLDLQLLFSRPKKDSYEQYKNTLVFEPENIEKKFLYCHYIIYTLFYSEKKALLEDEGTEDLETALLRILPILPSKLLMKLSVCSCSFRNRYIKNEVFSYQITKEGNAKKLSRDIEDVIIYKSKESIEEYPLWVRYISNILLNNKQQQLYKFCDKYNCYERSFIKDFSKLLYAVKEFRESYDLLEFLNLAKKLERGKEIQKRTLELIFIEDDEDILQNYNEGSVLAQLILEMQNIEGIFVKKKLKKSISEKNAKKLYLERDKRKIQMALTKYIHDELNEGGKAIVNELIKLLNPNDIKYFFDMDVNICSVLVTIDYRFLLCIDIWKQSKNYQLEMLNCVRNCKILSSDSILKCIVDTTKENISDEVYEIFQDKYVDFLYEYCKKGYMAFDYQIELWGHHLVLDGKKCMQLISQTSNGKMLVIIMKNVDSYNICDKEEMLVWIDAVAKNMNYIKNNYKYEAALFLMPLVLNTDKVSNVISQFVYDEVYIKLEKSEMDYHDWKKMESLLPEVDVQQSWDKCLRLRLAFEK